MSEPSVSTPAVVSQEIAVRKQEPEAAGVLPPTLKVKVLPSPARRVRRKGQRLSDAMLRCGLDVVKIAQKLNALVDHLGFSGRDAKLLLEVLKEASRVLDPRRPAQGASNAFSVQLVHNVPRPVRPALPQDAT